MTETSFILQTVFFLPGELKPIHFLNIHSRFALASVRKTITKRLKRRQFRLHSDGERGEAPVFAGYYRLRTLAVSGDRFKMCSGGQMIIWKNLWRATGHSTPDESDWKNLDLFTFQRWIASSSVRVDIFSGHLQLRFEIKSIRANQLL